LLCAAPAAVIAARLTPARASGPVVCRAVDPYKFDPGTYGSCNRDYYPQLKALVGDEPHPFLRNPDGSPLMGRPRSYLVVAEYP
jgi:hypothetical protein